MDHTTSKKADPKMKWVIIGIILVAVIVGVAYTLLNNGGSRSSSADDGSEHQAVFLTNGQVYFGVIENRGSDYLKLVDIYYLRVQSGLQQSGTVDENGDPEFEQATATSLVKLGDELHGPEDEMLINLEHVIFTERLKSDSQVISAITEHKNAPQE